MTPFF